MHRAPILAASLALAFGLAGCDQSADGAMAASPPCAADVGSHLCDTGGAGPDAGPTVAQDPSLASHGAGRAGQGQ